MLSAIAGATAGTAMSINGVSHDWPAPTGFASTFQMQDPVDWGTGAAPAGLSWVYRDAASNTFVCIEFNITGTTGEHSVSSITWYLAARHAPPTGTYVFRHGTTYPLAYAKAPALPSGFAWYRVTVVPGS